MAAIWVVSSPSSLPAAVVIVDVVRLAGLLGALLHGDEERVGAGLGDQGDGDLLTAATATSGGLRPRVPRVAAATGGQGQAAAAEQGQAPKQASATTVRR